LYLKRNYIKKIQMNKNSNQIEKSLNIYIKNEMENLYKKKIVNFLGKTTDTNEYYSELISKILIKNLKEFSKIKQITRKSSYYTPSHLNIRINPNSPRLEENNAKRLIGMEIAELGRILDFQIPLKSKSSDTGLGKIDLVSYNDKTNIFYLIEFKNGINKESLLRTTLEIFTYFKTIDKDKMLDDFLKKHNYFNNNKNYHGIQIKPAVLLTNQTEAYNELKKISKRPNLKQLFTILDIAFFNISIESKKYDLK